MPGHCPPGNWTPHIRQVMWGAATSIPVSELMSPPVWRWPRGPESHGIARLTTLTAVGVESGLAGEGWP